MDAREIAVKICRFVRGAQGMTHDEIAWFVEHITPIVNDAFAEERQSWRSRMGLTTSYDEFLIRAETAEKEVIRLNAIADRLAAAGMSK